MESIKSGIEQLGGEITGAVGQGMQELGAAKQQAVQAIEQTGTAQKSAVEASGKKAVQSIENIKQTATEAVEIAKSEAVQAVQTEGNNPGRECLRRRRKAGTGCARCCTGDYGRPGADTRK